MHFVLDSRKTVDEALEVIRGHTQEKLTLFYDDTCDFEGKIRNNNTFFLKRCSSFRNDFRPYITGKVYKGEDYTKIEVTIKNNILFYLGLGVILLLFFLSFAHLFIPDVNFRETVLPLLISPAAGSVLVGINYYEKNKAKEIFQIMFPGNSTV